MNAAELEVRVNPNTTVFARKLRAIAASFDALAEELEGIDAEAEAKAQAPEMVTGPGLGST